jgi:hypothetical protein
VPEPPQRRGRSSSRRGNRGRGIFAFTGQLGDHGADLHIVGAFGDFDRHDRAFVDRFEFHGGLVGLDLGHDVARLTVSPTFTSHRASCPAPSWARARAS